MAILNFGKRDAQQGSAQMAAFLQGYSIEVMPRTAAKIEDFRAILPAGTRVYIAHIEGTPIDDMVATAKRIAEEGFTVMPHVPARIVPDRAALDTWLRRYAEEAGVTEALVLAGGPTTPLGEFHSSMQLLETGLFDTHGFKRLHVAGHPEGNKDIDPDGSTRLVDEAVQWKNAFAQRTDAAMAMATQFAFDAQPVIAWAERLKATGSTLPIHVGVAGPTKLQTLIKFAIACGVGASMSVIQRRAKDVTKLLVPFEPTEVLEDLAAYDAANPDSLIAGVHIFPLDGIAASAEYAGRMTEQAPLRANGGRP
ncbi:methylenetetrahydrofolate reductase [Thetidibacter halocola]|uniref:Methylenetetrahydrofolate reductase n=1 Tax=Thetidibacter halocola TaxID=2827239 RepID=A0A8J7WGL6_9RHOB|nr:methylenetetrahydrofolate reductase [Thetidibacter halocola]MBS0124943.1 methylenetetrahydrofolate reductase [Thetidibacter halocola]